MNIPIKTKLKLIKKDLKELVKLSWRIIECKIVYYYPERVHSDWVEDIQMSDEDYDKMEIRYLSLCKVLGKPNTVVHKDYHGLGISDVKGNGMMEVDFTRHSVQLVLSKLNRSKEEVRKQYE